MTGRLLQRKSPTKPIQTRRTRSGLAVITRVRERAGVRVRMSIEDEGEMMARVSTKGGGTSTHGGTRNGKTEEHFLSQAVNQSVSKQASKPASKPASHPLHLPIHARRPFFHPQRGPPGPNSLVLSNHKQSPPEKEWSATDGGGWRVENRGSGIDKPTPWRPTPRARYERELNSIEQRHTEAIPCRDKEKGGCEGRRVWCGVGH